MQEIMGEVEKLAGSLPLDSFVFLGSLIEEIISSIPSPLILVTAGILAKNQGLGLLHIVWFTILASLGKTIGGWVFYLLADKGEDLLTGRFGKLLGVSHKDIERIGKYFEKSNKTGLVIFILRAFPLGPSGVVSLVCGFLKVNMRTYLQMTFAGYFVRCFIFLYVGYAGLQVYSEDISTLGSVVSTLFLLVLLLGIVLLFMFRRKRRKK